MSGSETGWQDGKTLATTAASDEASQAAESVPALTVLAHPEPSRVGDRLTLPALAAGLEVRLSRIEPVFAPPGEAREEQRRPLEERHISRRPIRFLHGGAPGAVALDRGEARTSVRADGEVVERRRDVSAADLERGVVVLLGRHVALLLHLLPVPLPEDDAGFGLIGESPGIVELRRELRRLATLDAAVLLRGETGTGKELAARALHDAGPRRGGPFVAVNMASLPAELAAAELFGAERGAFTGADRKKAGLFEEARGGTLFLDEIGETPSAVQPMLLRALENREIRPVGGSGNVTVDVRVLAATDADLDAAVAEATFRAPLYHRLAAYTVRLPALRERRDDIGRLFYHFFAQERAGVDGDTLNADRGERPWPSAEVVAYLARHDWPGNVRELQNAVRRLVISGRDAAPEVMMRQARQILAASALPSRTAASARESEDVKAAPGRRRLRKLSEVGEDELLAALEAHDYKLQPAAKALGLSRINLYRLIESSPNVRTATELERGEIEAALERHNGAIEAAATELRVSQQGLKRQITALGLDRS